VGIGQGLRSAQKGAVVLGRVGGEQKSFNGNEILFKGLTIGRGVGVGKRGKSLTKKGMSCLSKKNKFKKCDPGVDIKGTGLGVKKKVGKTWTCIGSRCS